VNVLVDKGVLYKRRGIGMFVAPGTRELLLAERRTSFADRFVEPLLVEARKLGLGPDDLSDLIRARAAGATGSTPTEGTAP
jgi:DNA-binding transcriptional regulator YhcF (GntR family)